MFGLGMGEILVIAVVALLFLGPEKLPQAAKTIGKGIRDLRKSTRELRDTLEHDTEIGDAVREIRSALHEDPRRQPPRPAASTVARSSVAPTGEAGGKETVDASKAPGDAPMSRSDLTGHGDDGAATDPVSADKPARSEGVAADE